MKKIGLGLLGLLLAGAIYYFTTGSRQITTEIKKQVNQELTLASNNGFLIQERKDAPKSDHFVLSFEDTEKITHFLNTQGIQVNKTEVENLKGLKLGIDMTYLANPYSSVSLDIYPLTLPTALHTAMQTPKDKIMLTQIDALLQKKAILLHTDLNKMGNGFKGYMKDIDTHFQSEEDVHILLKGMTFKGDIKNKKPQNINQKLKELKLTVANKIHITLKELQTDYIKTGNTAYDYQANYTIKQISVKADQTFSIYADNLTVLATSQTKDHLASGTMKSKAETISIEENSQKTIFDTFVIDTNASNLDITAINKLQRINPNNQEEISKVFQQLISQGVQMNISNFSVKNIHHNKQDLGGFTLLAHMDIDKSLNIQASKQNPLTALNAINADLKINLDKTLFSLIAQQPKAMMLMLFQPKDVNGKKVYSAELKDGKITLNGMPVN